MKYTVTHVCGHQQEHNITGPNTRGQRERQAERLSEGDCAECRRTRRESVQEGRLSRVLADAGVTLPDLTGSPSQITWAGTLRDRAVSAAGTLEAAAAATIREAAWWIDNRDDLAAALTERVDARLPDLAPGQPDVAPVRHARITGSDADWKRLEQSQAIADAMPRLRTAESRRVAHMLLVANRSILDWPKTTAARTREEMIGQAKALRRVLAEVLNVPIPLWHDLPPDERTAPEYAWLRTELDRHDTYYADSTPRRRLERAWRVYHVAKTDAEDAFDDFAMVAAAVNDEALGKERLSHAAIAEVVPGGYTRNWAAWLIRQGRKVIEYRGW